jgi:hypothetical protein
MDKGCKDYPFRQSFYSPAFDRRRLANFQALPRT